MPKAGKTVEYVQKRKWFQVTYPTIQLPSGMHGRSCAIRVIGRLASLLPKSGFRPTRINALKRVSRVTPDRNLLLGTAFRSSEKTTRFRATFPISMLLAYPFGSPHKSSPNPFDPTTHPRHLVSPSRREFLTWRTRCPVPSVRPRPFLKSPLPLRAFGPFPIKAVI